MLDVVLAHFWVRSTARLALAVSLVVTPGAGGAQQPPAPTSVGDHATVLGVNVALGGVTAGVFQLLRGGSFGKGFLGGSLGGAVVYAGKRVAGQQFDGAGLVGRELAAVGNSLVYNAAEGGPLLERFIVPLGPIPVRLHLTTTGGFGVRPTVDLASAGAIVYGLVAPDVRLDMGRSVSSGAAVFVRPARLRPPGTVVGGLPPSERIATTVGSVIFLTITADGDARVLAHEQVHVLQFDFVLAAWSDRLDAAMWDGVAVFDRYLRLNTLATVLGVASRTLFLPQDRDGLPWEVEARRLAGR